MAALIKSEKLAELALWKDPKRSGAALAGATFVWLLLEKSGYTLITLGANALLVLVLTLAAWTQGAKLLPQQIPPPPSPIEVSEAKVRCVVDAVVLHVNVALAYGYKLGTGTDLVATAQALLCLYVVSKLGALFHVLTLGWLAVVAFFTVPKVYQEKQTEIDALLAEAKTQIETYKAVIEKEVLSKIPKASAAPSVTEKKDE